MDEGFWWVALALAAVGLVLWVVVNLMDSQPWRGIGSEDERR